MSELEYLSWPKEKKRQFADMRREMLREKVDSLNSRHIEVQKDIIAAESRNSSVTNAKKAQRQEIASSARSTAERISRDVPRYTREWDREKIDWDRDKFDWNRGKKDSANFETYGNKRFQNYRTGEYQRKKYYKDYTACTPREKRNEQQNDNISEKKSNKSYNQRNKPYLYEGSLKQSQYQSSESSHNVQYSNERHKKYYYTKDPKKHHSKYQSSSTSTDSEFINNKVNKMRVSSTKTSALWHSDRVSEDKSERTRKWVKSVQDQKNISSEEENNNPSPKRKYDKHAIASDKCLDKNQISYLKSQKLVDDKSNTTVIKDNKRMKQRSEQKERPPRKSYTKFDRINRCDHSSEDITSSDEYDLDKIKSNVNCTVESKTAELNCNVESKLYDYNEKENGNSEETKINSKCNLKIQNYVSAGNKYKNEELSISACKSSNLARSHPIKKSNAASKISSNNVSREYTNNDGRCYFANNEKDRKKGFKKKRDSETDPKYNSPDCLKSDHITKQRKFDKQQSEWNKSVNKNKGVRKEQFDHKKKYNFNIPSSLNQDDDDDGWGNIEQANNEEDDGIWGSTDQSDIKWKINEFDNTGKREEAEVKSDNHHNEKGAKSFKVKNPTMSDDGGWSTVEEGEIISDDDLEENKEHVK